MTTLPVDETPLYVILREHEEYGPFCRETLEEAMEAGNIVEEDWVRKADRTSYWMSVGQLLYGPPEPEGLGIKMRRFLRFGRAALGQTATTAFSLASRALDRCAERLARWAGLVALLCAAVATATAFLPGRPIALSVPWIMAGIAAGVALILRRKVSSGIIACLAASIIPIATYQMIPAANHYFDPNRRENPLPPIGEMYSSMPRKSGDLPRNRPKAKSGIPALGLPMPADDGR
jgi:hypothetical protein